MKQHCKSKKSRNKDLRRIQASDEILKTIKSEQPCIVQMVIDKLTKLDLSHKPEKKVKDALDKIKQIPIMVTRYNIGKEIERAVPNTESEPVFNTVSRISYKPQKYNTDFQRASTPDNTMFYGCVIPENVSNEEIDNARVIGAAETCELIRNENAEDGKQLITFGKWRVKEELNLATIVNPDVEYKVEYLKKLVADYQKCLNTLSKDIRKSYQILLKFITSEFSKTVDKGKNYNYMISAIFTEMLITSPNNNIDGVIYPSVQTDGNGLCIAILPESMNKLELIKVLQCKAIRKGKKVSLDNVSLTLDIHSDGTFNLTDI
jgi:hypothetical protein